MSRIYDNQPLTNLPVRNVTWNGTWDHHAQVSAAKVDQQSAGLLVEGIVVSKSRLSVTSSQNSAAAKARYYVLYLTIEQAHSRKFDEKGKELEPNFSETSKVSTGYLNSSYNVKAKGDTDRLSSETVKSSLKASPVNALLQGIPNGPDDSIAVFMREEDLDKVELPIDTAVRVKTVGASPFLESIVVRDESTASKGNFTGDESMGGNWTDKIMAVKALQAGDREEEPSEIADEEWDD